MKGKISLKDFIKEVKQDLIDAIDNENPFFEMREVELEVAFSVDAEAKAGAKFIVQVGAAAKSTQTHRVKLKLTPLHAYTKSTPAQEGQLKYLSQHKGKRPVKIGFKKK
jgi:hypothetical protein